MRAAARACKLRANGEVSIMASDHFFGTVLRTVAMATLLIGCGVRSPGDADAVEPVDAGRAAAPASVESRSPIVSRISALSGHEPRLTALLDAARFGLVAGREGLESPGYRASSIHDEDMLAALLPKSAAGVAEVSVSRFARLTARVQAVGARDVPFQLEEGRAVYRDAYASTDLVVLTTALVYESLLVLRDAAAPTEFAWRIELASGLRLIDEPGGSLVFVDAQNEARLRIPVPFAVDAAGVRRDAQMQFDGGRLVVRLDRAGLAYPILLDPAIETAVWTNRKSASNADTYVGDNGSTGCSASCNPSASRAPAARPARAWRTASPSVASSRSAGTPTIPASTPLSTTGRRGTRCSAPG